MGCKSSFICIYFHFPVNVRLGSTFCTYNRLCVPFSCSPLQIMYLHCLNTSSPQKGLRNHKRWEFDSHSGNTTLGDKICQWFAADWWFSPVSSTNKTDRHDKTEILLKVALNTISPKTTKREYFFQLDFHSHTIYCKNITLL
jgi:hypothetical protein